MVDKGVKKEVSIHFADKMECSAQDVLVEANCHKRRSNKRRRCDVVQKEWHGGGGYLDCLNYYVKRL